MGQIYQHQLPNGMRLAAEHIASAQSVAITALMPAGVTTEPENRQGVATLVAEMVCRGAGDLDARDHSDALDRLGVQRGTGVETNHLRLGATMLAQNLHEALPLLVDMIRRPTLSNDTLDPSRDLALQAIAALEDEPQQKVFLELRGRHYPSPICRSPLGQAAHIESISEQDIRQFWKSTFVPDQTILGIAGRFDWDRLLAQINQLFTDWKGTSHPTEVDHAGSRDYHHVMAESAQVHIGLMYDALPEPDDSSILCRAATAILSGGMSSRLFTQLREKRGLCYSVYAAYASQKDRGAILSYVGTTAPRAQESLDLLKTELLGLCNGIDENEFNRAIVGMKSRLVMQGESTTARASAIAMDQYLYGRPRQLHELIERVDGITTAALRQFVAENPPGPMTIVTIGPESLNAT